MADTKHLPMRWPIAPESDLEEAKNEAVEKFKQAITRPDMA